MPSRKAIKRRIISVKTTKQIVKAMNMVAATKLSKTKTLYRSAQPMFDEFNRVIDRLKDSEQALSHVFFQERAGNKAAYVVISGDRGYCGSYNTNVASAALNHMESAGKDEAVFAIGLRSRDFFQRREKRVAQWHRGICEKARYEEVKQIADTLVSLYLSGELDEVYIAYTKFETVLTHTPTLKRLLPIGDGGEPAFENALCFEPDADTILEHAVPQYVSAFLFGAILESGCCEQAARMVSMDAATKSAQEIIEDLTRLYNRKRQAHITQEITEIIGGANVT